MPAFPRFAWTGLRANLVANLFAQGWAVLLAIAFVPVLLHLVGAEGYGLVGFAASLQAVLAVLDLGLATTANREFARLRAQGQLAGGRALLRTLEWAYALMGLLIAGGLALAAPWIAEHWIRPDRIPPGTVALCLALLGLSVGVRWPVALYAGVLRGLDRQVALNGLVVLGSTLRTAGIAAVLAVRGGGVLTYFAALAALSVVEVALHATLAWRSQTATPDATPRFEAARLRALWRFSGEVALVSLFAAALKQMDKVLIARLEPLPALGAYNVAATLAGGLLLCAAPVFATVFPRFSADLARRDEGAAATLYHRASALVALAGAPIAATLVFFPEPILAWWTRDPAVARSASGALALLSLGMLLNGCLQVPYAMQLAAGLTRISLWINGIGVALLAPLLVVLVGEVGITGGGAAWALFNLAYFLTAPAVLHRRVLRGHLASWMFRDTLPYVGLALGCFAVAGHGIAGLDLWSVLLRIGAATAVYWLLAVLIWNARAITFRRFTGVTYPPHRQP